MPAAAIVHLKSLPLPLPRIGHATQDGVLKCCPELAGGGESILGARASALTMTSDASAGTSSRTSGERRGVRRQDLRENHLGRRSREGRLTCEHLVGHTADRVYVARTSSSASLSTYSGLM